MNAEVGSLISNTLQDVFPQTLVIFFQKIFFKLSIIYRKAVKIDENFELKVPGKTIINQVCLLVVLKERLLFFPTHR